MKINVRLLSLNLNERDLSIALVGLKQYANMSDIVKKHYNITIHQWNKNYDEMGKPNTIEGLPLDKLIEELEPLNTEIIGFSTYIWNFEFMMKIAQTVKSINPKIKTLFGGSQAGGMGKKLFTIGDYVDFLISGEAELSFRKFLIGHLENDYSTIENLYFLKNDKIVKNIPEDARMAKKQSYLERIDELPYPFRDKEYRQFLDDLDYKVTAQFETERGCPLSCTFCSWGTRLPIRRRRQRDVEEGLTYLLNHPNVRAVYIVDANPFIKDEKGLWLTEFLLHKNKSGKPVFFELNPEYVRNSRVIENLGKLSGDELAFGLQSTSDKTLKIIKRRFNRGIYEKNVKALKSMNPNANIKFSLIVGLPGDDYSSFTKSLDFVISMNPADIYVHDLLILPGSEMYENPDSFNIKIEELPPHRLIENKTFPKKDYNRAKKLGYYAKLIHKYKWLSSSLLDLKNEVRKTHIYIYESFMKEMDNSGLNGLMDNDIDNLSTEKFDYLTDRFINSTNKENKLRKILKKVRKIELAKNSEQYIGERELENNYNSISSPTIV